MPASSLILAAALAQPLLFASPAPSSPREEATPREQIDPRGAGTTSTTDDAAPGEEAPDTGERDDSASDGAEAPEVAPGDGGSVDEPVEADPRAVRSPPEDEYPAPDAFPAREASAAASAEERTSKEGEGERAGAAAQEVGAKQKQGDGAKAKKERGTVQVELTARVMAGFAVTHENATVEQETLGYGDRDDLDYAFELRQARLAAHLDARKLSLKLSLDLADALETVGERFFIRDAWANVKIVDAFQLRAGRFKRPFSRLQLTGVGNLAILGRGLFNALAITELAWGDRGVGVMAWGKIRGERAGRLTWSFAGLNGTDAIIGNPDSKAIDTVARVEYAPRKWVSIGVNGVMKYVSPDGKEQHQARFAAGGDLRFRHRGFESSIEVDAAQNWQAATVPWMFGAVGYMSYVFSLPKEFGLQPAVFGEYMDANLDFTQSEAVRVAGGLNLLWTEHLRVMPQVDFVRPLSVGTGDYTNSIVASETYALILAVEL